jgi:hypothetical protein
LRVFDINVSEALAFLSSLRVAIDQSRLAMERGGSSYYETSWYRQANSDVTSRLLGLRRIAERVAPELVDKVGPTNRGFAWPWGDVDRVTHELDGYLRQEAQLRSILTPIGPSIAASQLHPWVWEASARLWDDGHRRMALQGAATAIELQLKAKLGVDRSGVELVTRAFNTSEPRPGDPRLRFANGTEGTDSWNNAHEGAMQFARGCMMRIRNLATHGDEEPEEQDALEQLAALSVLARWIDRAAVVRTEG